MMKTKITFLPKYTYFVLCFIYKKNDFLQC